MKFKVGEIVNVPMAIEVFDALGIIFKYDIHRKVYGVQMNNHDWEWYREDEIEKLDTEFRNDIKSK